MALRDKIKKTFSSKKGGSGDSTPTGNSPPRRTDIEYYKPNEIPPSKYRGRVDKEHQKKLDAFSFTDAFAAMARRPSQALSGTFSPGGTQAQSRRASWMSRTKSSMSTASSVGGSDQDGRSLRRKSAAAAVAPAGQTLAENDDDDTDVTNTGISRTATRPDERPRTNGQLDIPTLRLEQANTITQPGRVSPQHDTPFTVEELERAMTRATLKSPRDTILAQPAGITA